MSEHPFQPSAHVPISCAVCGQEQRFHGLQPDPVAEALAYAESADTVWESVELIAANRTLAAEVRALRQRHADMEAYYKLVQQTMNRTQEAVVAALRQRHDAAQRVVAEQAEDAGLWFVATSATEAYLQRALRRLHAAVEGP